MRMSVMPFPNLSPNVKEENDNIPEITRMQIELLVNGFRSDFARVATFQITNSVGHPRMKWLGIDEGHHGLSHEPDSNEDSYEKLIRINTWYAEQVASVGQAVGRNARAWRRRFDVGSHHDCVDE